jgi:hypothetical protein
MPGLTRQPRRREDRASRRIVALVNRRKSMHTAICTFNDRAAAQQAAERLVQSGFDRREVHVEHRHADGSPMADGDALGERRDREHDVVGKFSFFERLFGAGKHAPHVDTYSRAVEQGLYVVLVEGRDEAEAARAQNVLYGLNPADLKLVHRAGERPLRDVVAEREAGSVEQGLGTARLQPERAMASQGWGEQRELKVVDDDRPIASPDIASAHEDRDKPR